jgi:hypothetical protein
MLAALANGTCSGGVDLLLWIVAVIVGIWGIVSLLRGAILAGIVLIILAFLIGPGGVSLIC